MKESDFIFDSVQLIYCKCHKVNFKRGDWYIDSPYWIKKKKQTINPKIEDHKCFQYATSVALIYDEVKWNSERFSNIKPSINKHGYEGMNYSSKIGDLETFERDSPTVAFNILCIKEKEIRPTYISKHNLTHEKQIILLMIPNEEKEGWHYLAVRKLPTLLRGITSKHHGDFYCLNWAEFF